MQFNLVGFFPLFMFFIYLLTLIVGFVLIRKMIQIIDQAVRKRFNQSIEKHLGLVYIIGGVIITLNQATTLGLISFNSKEMQLLLQVVIYGVYAVCCPTLLKRLMTMALTPMDEK